MFRLPPLPPSWDGFHPLIVHFPIGLLAVAPLLVVLGLILRKHERGLNVAALTLMALGTAAAFLAVSTGEAAEDAATVTGPVHRLIEEHGEAAEFARTLFVVLTLAFAGITLLPTMAPKLKRSARVGAAIGFLVLYAVSLLPLMNAGHLGGELVHSHGVRANLSSAAPAGPNQAIPSTTRPERDEDE